MPKYVTSDTALFGNYDDQIKTVFTNDTPKEQRDKIQSMQPHVDWEPFLSEPKNQEQCGSCWAHATNALLEYYVDRGTNDALLTTNPAEVLLDSKSKQQRDQDEPACAKAQELLSQQCGGNAGCGGATALLGLHLAQCKGSTMTWTDPGSEQNAYERSIACLTEATKAGSGSVSVSVSECMQQLDDAHAADGGGVHDITHSAIRMIDPLVDAQGKPCAAPNTECFPNVTGIMSALQDGPIAIGVDATPLQQYRKTQKNAEYVVGEKNCSAACGYDDACVQECSHVATIFEKSTRDLDLDHAVTLVGYGTDSLTKTPYWKIRNSWGTEYGENGYVRVARDTDAYVCGVDTKPLDGYGCVFDEQHSKQTPKSAQYCGPLGFINSHLVQLV